MEMKRVVIVAHGNWGSMKDDDYGNWTEAMVRVVESARRTDFDTGQELPCATAEVVPTVAVLREQLGPYSRPDIVIFRTRSMLEEARAIKREHPNVRVVVFTGLIPNDEVIIVSKGWELDSTAIQSIVLR
ncbi:MAG: hypothetical protein V1723_00830 [Candidatus Uhrbacteria bacterium]